MWGERGVHPLDGKEFGETSETVATTEHAGIIIDFAGGNGRGGCDAVDCGDGGVFVMETTYPLFDQGFLRLAAIGDFFDE